MKHELRSPRQQSNSGTNPGYKDRMRQVASTKMTKRWADPEARAKLEAANADIESRAKKSKATKEHWNDPEVGARLLRAVLGVCSEHTNYKHGWYFSEKMQQEFHYRSSYELRAYQILDADPFVTFFFPEPIAIPYLAEDGQVHRYVPDLYIEYKSGYWQFLEIKPEARLKEADNELKHRAATGQYAGHFQVWTEANLEQVS